MDAPDGNRLALDEAFCKAIAAARKVHAAKLVVMFGYDTRAELGNIWWCSERRTSALCTSLTVNAERAFLLVVQTSKPPTTNDTALPIATPTTSDTAFPMALALLDSLEVL